MKFRTVIDTGRAPFRLEAEAPTLWIGSCFTDHIGSRLRDCMSPAEVNPCGVQYNPESIVRLLECAMENEGVRPESMFFHGGMWRCWLMPSAFGHPDRQEAEERANCALRSLRGTLKDASAMFVSFGTAQVYEHIPSGTSQYSGVVSNCHKVPSGEFDHRMLRPDEIADRWEALAGELRRVNKDLKIVYTVSPVRHLNPSPRMNTLSKSTLHLATDRLVGSDPEGSFYFGAWELLMDDLRDYRFYGRDLTHPSEEAVEYIWESFCRSFYSEKELRILDEGASIMRRLSHRRMTAAAESDRLFREKTAEMAERFMQEHPGMRLQEGLSVRGIERS